MCGIAGIADFIGPAPSEGLLRKMLGLIRHRGPDAFGIYLDEHAGLAHARPNPLGNRLACVPTVDGGATTNEHTRT